MGPAESPLPHWQGEPWCDTSEGPGLAVSLGGLDEAEAVGRLPSPMDIIWQAPCWAYPTKPTPSRRAGPGLYGIII